MKYFVGKLPVKYFVGKLATKYLNYLRNIS